MRLSFTERSIVSFGDFFIADRKKKAMHIDIFFLKTLCKTKNAFGKTGSIHKDSSCLEPGSRQICALAFKHVTKQLFTIFRGNRCKLGVIHKGGESQLSVAVQSGGERIFLIQHMPGNQWKDAAWCFSGKERIDLVTAEEGIGFHDGISWQIGNLAPVGYVDVGDQVSQPQQRFDQHPRRSTGPSGRAVLSDPVPARKQASG